MEKETQKRDLLEVLRNDKLLPTNAVAKRLGISRSTVYRLVLEGKLRAVRFSERNIRILESSIREYLEKMNPDMV